MEKAEERWVDLRQMRGSRDGADVTCPRLSCGMVAEPGREAAFLGCPREMPGGNLSSISRGMGMTCHALEVCLGRHALRCLPGCGSFLCRPRWFLSCEGETSLCPRPDP